MISFLQKTSKKLSALTLIFSFLNLGQALAEEKSGTEKEFEQEERSAASTVKLIEVADHIKDLIKNMKEETEGRISTEKQRFFSLPDIADKKIKDVEKTVNQGLSQINKLVSMSSAKLSDLSQHPAEDLIERVNGLDLESISLVKEKIGFDSLFKEVSKAEQAIFEKIKNIETQTPSAEPAQKSKTKS